MLLSKEAQLTQNSYYEASVDRPAASAALGGRISAWNITVEAMQLIRSRIAEHAIECDFVPGFMNLAVNEKKGRQLAQATIDMQKRYGYQMQPIAAAVPI